MTRSGELAIPLGFLYDSVTTGYQLTTNLMSAVLRQRGEIIKRNRMVPCVMTSYVEVGPAEDLPPGERTIVEVDSREVMVINYDGTYHAVSNRCTHQGWSLEEAEVRDGVITCPFHRDSFDIESGAVVGPPPDESLPCYDVVVEDGVVQVKG